MDQKKKLQISSGILLGLWFFPVILVSLFINPEFILETAFWTLLYCCPFGIAGISGLLLKANTFGQLKALVIIFICLLIYCILNAVFCIILFFSIFFSNSNNESDDDDDTGLGRGIAILFGIIAGIGVVYFLLAAWMGWRGFSASRTMRDLLILRGSPVGYQQYIDANNLTFVSLPNYQSQFNAGHANANPYPPNAYAYPQNH